MVDSINLAGVIGTWIAVALALVALIGIVGPFLILRETRSERYKATNAIDAQNSGYLSHGLKLPGSRGHLFLRVKAPLLSEAPGPMSFQVEERTLRKEKKRLTNFSSKTGWVHLGLAIQTYSTGLNFGDSMIIRNQQTWLPVQRFWLLRIGLLGRYGHRDDGGKKRTAENANRLRIEEREGGLGRGGERRRSRDMELDSEKAKWEESPSADRLSGLTGTLWWRLRLSSQSESRIDEVYFSPHPVSTRQALYPDPIQLPNLFWLSLGCLPFGTGDFTVAYDLGVFLESHKSRPRARNGLIPIFSKFQLRGDIDNAGPYGGWATSVGVDMSRLLCRQPVDSSEDWFELACDAEDEKGDWYAFSNSNKEGYLWRGDAQRLALAVTSLELSPMGVLFDKKRAGDHAIFTGCAEKVSILAHSLQQIVSPYIQQRFDPLRSFESKRDFSRAGAEASYDIDILNLQGLMESLPLNYKQIIGILTLTSKSFFASLKTHPYIEVDVPSGVVRTPTFTGEVMAHPFDFCELFPDVPTLHRPTTTRFNDKPAILAAALAACLRGKMLEESMDAAKLIDTIQKMDSVTQVAASTAPPPLPPDSSQRSRAPSSGSAEYPEMRGEATQHLSPRDEDGPGLVEYNTRRPATPTPGMQVNPVGLYTWPEEDEEEVSDHMPSTPENVNGKVVNPVLTSDDEDVERSKSRSRHEDRDVEK